MSFSFSLSVYQLYQCWQHSMDFLATAKSRHSCLDSRSRRHSPSPGVNLSSMSIVAGSEPNWSFLLCRFSQGSDKQMQKLCRKPSSQTCYRIVASKTLAPLVSSMLVKMLKARSTGNEPSISTASSSIASFPKKPARNPTSLLDWPFSDRTKLA